MANQTIQRNPGLGSLLELSTNLKATCGAVTSQRQFFIYLLFFVCVTVFLVQMPALSARASFLDDHQYVLDNPLVLNPSWSSVRHFFVEVWCPSTVRGYYQPLTMVSLMLDRLLGGPGDIVRTCHRTSLLLHVANTALLAVLLFTLFGRPVIAACVALLFGLHPMTVEQICWMAERKTVLATFFALWSLIAYVRYTRDPEKRYYAGCMTAYVLALLSKPIVVPLPLMMVLMDYWPLGRWRGRSVTEKIPLFAIGAVSAVITFVSQSRAASVQLLGDYNPWRMPLILCHNIVFYLRRLLWPVDLLAYYDAPSPMSLGHPMVLIGVVGTVILVSLLIVSCRWTRALLAGTLIFFAMIFPAMGIVSVTPTIAANRYAYLPSIGFLMVLVSLLVWIGGTRGRSRVAVRRVVPVLAVLALAGMESVPMRRYLAQWGNTVRLHEYMLAIAPRSPRIHASLGAALTRQGSLEDAIVHYRTALGLLPSDSRTRYNLAVALQGMPAKTDEAIEQYEKVLESDTIFASEAALNLGSLRLRKGQVEEAIDHFQAALDTRQGFPLALHNLGKMLVVTGKSEEGIQHLREAVRIGPGFLLAVKDLGWLFATHPDGGVRDPDEALGFAERAVALTGRRDAGVLDVLAAAYACDAQYARAVETAQEALTIARRLRNDELAARIEEHLRVYEMERPYIESPRVRLDRLVAKTKKEEQAAAAAETKNSTLRTHN